MQEKKKKKAGGTATPGPVIEVALPPLGPVPTVPEKVMIPEERRRAIRDAEQERSWRAKGSIMWEALTELVNDDGRGGIKCSYCGARWGTHTWSNACPPYAVYVAEEVEETKKEGV